MRLLDLFSGAGGSAVGYHRAGFDEIVGVDIVNQPRYPFQFVKADALEFCASFGAGFDAIHASPPCQRWSMYSRNLGTAHLHEDFIIRTRATLINVGRPYVIENVEGAPLMNAIRLCGSSFGLRVQRHRRFESNVFLFSSQCEHDPSVLTVPVYGHGSPQWHRKRWGRNVRLSEKKDAMGIQYMTGWELSQAIPPAYCEFIGAQLLAALRS